MIVQELSANRKIARLTTLTQELQQARNADQTLWALQQGFADVGGFVATVLLSTRGLPPGHYRIVSTQVDSARQEYELSRTGPGSLQSGGVLAAIIARPEPQVINNLDWSHDPLLHDVLDGYSSAIALPLAGDRLPMNWAVLLKKFPQQFSVTDLEQAVERVVLIGSLLENQILAEELSRANQQIENEARQVGALQRALLPELPARMAGLEIATSYLPCGRAGGDVYDLFSLDENENPHAGVPGNWAIFIGDAAGHGLAAAVVMSIVQAVLHARPSGMSRPASLLKHANRQLCSKNLTGFVTGFLGLYQPASRRLTYVNAGHPSPLLKRSRDGSICPLEAARGYPMGIDDTQLFEEAAIELEPGDTLLLYTDGITEARNANDDFFEQDRLAQIFRDSGAAPADLIQRVRAAVLRHEQDALPRDDQTLLALTVLSMREMIPFVVQSS